MNTMSEMNETFPARRSYLPLWILIAVFVIPYVLAAIFYTSEDARKLGQATNYGELISPVIALANVEFNTLDNKILSMESLRGKWVLLTVGDSVCDEQCQKNMYYIRQARKAMAADRTRVERLFVLTDTQYLDAFRQGLQSYSGMHVMSGPEAANRAIISTLAPGGEDIRGRIYIIDPLGNAILMYPAGSDPDGVVHDLRRLLKVSKIG